MMKFAMIAAALAVTLLCGPAPALAQSTETSAARAAVGHWLYDADDSIIGSVYGITDGGRTVILQYGSYLTPGRKLVLVPADNVTIVNGHATLRGLLADDLISLPSVG